MHEGLRIRGVDAYLDVLDVALNADAERLTEHLRGQLANCDHLIAVLSSATRLSWWVPFEIGLATERDYPIATYSQDGSPLPDYLRKWPYLRTRQDLDTYAGLVLDRQRDLLLSEGSYGRASAKAAYAPKFERDLKARLGQQWS